MDNSAYGGFVVSKNILNGVPVGYSYREKSRLEQLNGWNLLSTIDDDEYVANPENFSIVTASTLAPFAPVMLAIFDAPYGTDLEWEYEQDVLIGFYDLKRQRETTIAEILEPKEGDAE